MNWWLLAGAMLVLGAAMAHSLLGEKVILHRLFRRATEGDPAAGHNRRAVDDPLTRQTLRLAWHSLSVVLLGLSAILLVGAVDGGAFGGAWRAVMLILTATFAGLAVLSLAIARGRHIGWMWFAATALATWLSVT
jgi:hypothetical protein